MLGRELAWLCARYRSDGTDRGRFDAAAFAATSAALLRHAPDEEFTSPLQVRRLHGVGPHSESLLKNRVGLDGSRSYGEVARREAARGAACAFVVGSLSIGEILQIHSTIRGGLKFRACGLALFNIVGPHDAKSHWSKPKTLMSIGLSLYKAARQSTGLRVLYSDAHQGDGSVEGELMPDCYPWKC